ncbi:MAG: hypothetical protein HOG35_13425 [Candidatus Marinimicrobia bacterium]|nr:hypothetical protein [Candidatus Neomarinimicrobiota bacterium]
MKTYTAEAFANRIEYRKYLVRSGLADDLKPNVTLSIALDNYIDYVAIQKKANTIEREMCLAKFRTPYRIDSSKKILVGGCCLI